ncbi:hypothetical protein LX95_02892 [Mesonia algae]|uniref:Uncharacterized protein n=1 Tax=Mesonia algae TaxID=213248 RepID=A0A2W7IFM5_9FLAO|nr:hypothetical protein [Mesonia algae]PZW37030.1 hypothetical protein LX95_02892 [Mesonia algae]
MTNNIKIKESKKSGKLIYSESILLKLLEIPWFIFCVSFLPYFFGYQNFKQINLEKMETIIIPILYLTSSILIAFCYFQLNKLKRCKNIIIGNNKNLIKNYLKDLVERREWTIIENNDKVDILEIPFHDRATGWDKRITILYDKNDLLINCSTFGWGGVKLPIDLFCNRYLEDRLIERMQKKIKTHYNKELR